jgi:5-methylcytosine-specific restriction endonuclease McrA
MEAAYFCMSDKVLKHSLYLGCGAKISASKIIRMVDVNIIRSETVNYTKPLIIRLFNYISHKTKNLRVNRQRLYKRDNNECAYCGSKKELTIDHIIPKSRGGKNTWNNLITCCLPCNLKKGDKTPDEARMPLRFQPKTPTLFISESSIAKIWEDYKSSFVS